MRHATGPPPLSCSVLGAQLAPALKGLVLRRAAGSSQLPQPLQAACAQHQTHTADAKVQWMDTHSLQHRLVHPEICCAPQDVLTQVLAAAQPNLITAAALRVLQQPHLRTQPAKPPNSPPSSNPRSPTQPGGSPSAHSPSSTSEPAASSSASSSTGQGRSGARGDSGFREGTGSASTDTSSDGRVFSEGSTGAARKGPWLWLRYLPHLRWHFYRFNASTCQVRACCSPHQRLQVQSVPSAQSASADQHCPCRRGGIDVAERLWRDVLKDVRQTSDLEYQHARIRLEQVLETYTDITRFPLYVMIYLSWSSLQHVKCMSLRLLTWGVKRCGIRC